MQNASWLKPFREAALKRKEKCTPAEIMRVNRRLARAYVILREDFEEFYECRSGQEASRFLKEWTTRGTRSRLGPFIRLAKRLRRSSAGILTHLRHRIANAASEGIDNKIEVPERRAYGFHDLRYFMLKILEATGAQPPLEALGHPQT